MATNYTGSKTATQSPSPTPNPGVSPVVSIPADGDPENAASVAQAWKALADLCDWLTKPQAKSTDWAAAIMRYRNALGHTRGLFDHLGLPGGRIVQWDEIWDASAAGSVSGTLATEPLFGSIPFAYSATVINNLSTAGSALTAASVAANFAAAQTAFGNAGADLTAAAADLAAGSIGNRWNLKGVQTSGVGYALALSFGSIRMRGLSVECGDTTNDYTQIWRYPSLRFDDNISFAIEWEMQVPAANLPHRSIFVGLCDTDLRPGPSATATNYALFELDSIGNWLCLHGGSGGNANTDSLQVATVGSFDRFRIEFQGANVADDSTRTLRYYINGALKATVTTKLPDATADLGAHISIINTSGGASGFASPPGPMLIGPMRFRGSIYPADVT